MNEQRNRFWLAVSTALFSMVGSFIAATVLFLRLGDTLLAIVCFVVALFALAGAVVSACKSIGISDERWTLDEALFYFVMDRVPEFDDHHYEDVSAYFANWSERVPEEAQMLKDKDRYARRIFDAARRSIIRIDGIQTGHGSDGDSRRIHPSYFMREDTGHHAGNYITYSRAAQSGAHNGFRDVLLYKDEIVALKRRSYGKNAKRSPTRERDNGAQ